VAQFQPCAVCITGFAEGKKNVDTLLLCGNIGAMKAKQVRISPQNYMALMRLRLLPGAPSIPKLTNMAVRSGLEFVKAKLLLKLK
jgi:hypothetical protein